jgi:uncharacterized DUF497 family protein
MKMIWDEDKNQENIKKHKISFQEAETVFYDLNGAFPKTSKSSQARLKPGIEKTRETL